MRENKICRHQRMPLREERFVPDVWYTDLVEHFTAGIVMPVFLNLIVSCYFIVSIRVLHFENKKKH